MPESKQPIYACFGPHKPTNLDKIIERKGPYIKFWVRTISVVQPYITNRDVAHIKEGRSAIYKFRDGEALILVVRNGKPSWKRAVIDPMHTN